MGSARVSRFSGRKVPRPPVPNLSKSRAGVSAGKQVANARHWHTRRVPEQGGANSKVTNADRDLIQTLAVHGVSVTPTQLKRWRAANLLPTPLQRTAGRGRGRPSETYPVGAVD